MTTILFRSRSSFLWLFFVLLILGTQPEASCGTKRMEVIGIFFNVGSSTVQLNVLSLDKKETTVMTLDPGRVESTAVVEGEARVYTPSKSMTSGRLLSMCRVPALGGAPEFFEKSERAFYFRVHNGKVNLVKPSDLNSREKKLLEAFKRQRQHNAS